MNMISIIASPQAPTRPRESKPLALTKRFMQGHLDLRRATPAHQTGRQNLGVVEHQNIASLQQPRQIANPPVGENRPGLVQQARVAARLDRRVGD